VRRGGLRSRADVWFNQPVHRVIEKRIRGSRFQVSTLGDKNLISKLVDGPFGTQIKVGDYRDSGIPLLRVSNCRENEVSDDNLVYIEPEHHARLLRSEVRPSDVVFTKTGHILGYAAVFPKRHERANISSHLVLMRTTSRLLPEFLAAYLRTDAGQDQVYRWGQKATKPELNTIEIRQFLIPVPKPEQQRELLAALTAARATQREKLAQADALLTGLDGLVLDALGLTAPVPHDPSKPFAVRLKAVRGSRLDPPAYTPFPIPSNPRRIPIERLAKVAGINANVVPRPAGDNPIVPYVGLPECDLNDVREVATRTYAEAKGRSIARVGDILFARIEPSIFNKKFVFVEHLGGHDHAYLSTEFYTVRAHGDEYDQRYLYAMFQSAFVFNQLRGKTTGSSGRRRLDPEMFASLLVPWPDRDIRKKVAAEVVRRREEARRLRGEARTIWDDAKRRFEEELLGPETSAEEPKTDSAKRGRKQ
jgi:type I restriction enzyme, S subunit